MVGGKRRKVTAVEIIQRSPEPFYYPGGKTGILLIHGFTGSASEMRPMGEYFHKLGYTVYAPLLKGHGTNPEDLRQTHRNDWWQGVLDAYDYMVQSGVEKIYVAGLSMGGVLALKLAMNRPLSGVVTMCSPIWVQDRRAKYVEFVYYFIPYLERQQRNRRAEIESAMFPYDRTPLRSLAQLFKLIRRVRYQLHKVKVPALIVQSTTDETVRPESANYIYSKIGSLDKTLSWYERSSHIITLDRERRKLFREVEEFILRTSSASQ